MATTSAPHPNRKRRWNELNEIFRQSKRTNPDDDLRKLSKKTWRSIENVFQLKSYSQPKGDIDERHLEFFKTYLNHATMCFKGVIGGSDSGRHHLITSILVCVCSLFNGDVTLIMGEDLIGKEIEAQCHCDFILKRGNKAICIVQAKKGKFSKFTGKCLIGCELLAERYDLDVVYGIVTNYTVCVFFA